MMAKNLLDEARDLLALSWDDKNVVSFVKRRGAEYVNGIDKSETTKQQAVLSAAIAAHVAASTGRLLPKGQTEKAGQPGLGAKNYAGEFAGWDGDKPAVSPTNVPHWRDLGFMLAVVGVTPEYAKRGEDKSTWQLACQTPGDVLHDAVYADGATPESVREALLTVRHPNGKRIASPAQGGTGTPGEPGGSTDESTSVADRLSEDPLGTALDALALVAAACKAIPNDEDGRKAWGLILDAMVAIQDREITIRTAPKSAPRKRAAKRTESEKIPA